MRSSLSLTALSRSSENGRERAAAAAAAEEVEVEEEDAAAGVDDEEGAPATLAAPPLEFDAAEASEASETSPSLRSATGWAALCRRWSGERERLALLLRPEAAPLEEEQRRLNAAPLIASDDAQELPALPLTLIEDVLHASLSASSARSAIADEEASRLIESRC